MASKKSRPDPPPKPEPKKKQNSLVGDKIRAGVLLSTKLRTIAQEATEHDDRPDGGGMITKSEALARLMWKMALGYTTKVHTKDKGTIETVHAPDRGMIQLIWDRIEGRAAPVNDNLQKKRKLPKKVSDANKELLNNMAKNKMTEDKNAD